MSDLKENKRIFRPVKGEEEKILSLAPTDGWVYFATDTQKIYLGNNGSFVPMSQSKGFYYGNKEIIIDNSGAEQEKEVIFSLLDEQIEGDKLPEVDDLILNIDGCFYRIIEVIDEDSVLTTRLTLQGSGTGGGQGGSSGVTNSYFRITSAGGTKIFPAEATEAILTFKASDTLDSNNYIETVECAWNADFTDIIQTWNDLSWGLTAEQQVYEISIINHLSKFNTYGTKDVYLRVTDRYGVQRSTNKTSCYKIKLANLQLVSSAPELIGITNDTYDYVCNIGSGSGFDRRELVYTLVNESGVVMPGYPESKELSSSSTNSTKTLNFSNIDHGIYNLSVQLVGEIDGVEIKSNVLTYKILCYKEEVSQPLFATALSSEIQQYTNVPISWLLVYGNEAKEYTMDIKVDNKVETSQIITNNVLESYNLTFDRQGTYTLELAIDSLGVQYSEIISVVRYTGVLPVIDIDRDDLKVYLTAKGRTNNATDKETWSNYRNDTQKGQLKDFYYRTVNGWMKDDDDVDYLKINQGAKFEFTEYTPFTNPATTGYTIELDFQLKGVLDYSSPLIQCVSHDKNGDIKTGFVITGDKFRYYVNGTQIDEDTGDTTYFSSFDLVENKRIRLTFVIEENTAHNNLPLCYIYLDGICSGIYSYTSSATDGFTNYGQNLAYFTVDSTAGEVDLYNLRFYSSALPAATVLSNYQASLPDLASRQKDYEENLLLDSLTSDMSLGLIQAQNEAGTLQIPYVLITGGYGADKSFKMAAKTSNSVAALPTGKEDFRAIDIEVHYPKGNDYFKDYEDFSMKSTYEDPSLDVLTAFGQTAITGALMYAQGTSSIEYPTKNLRVKLKGDKIRVRPDISPVDLICFKADFMESAGANNTGSANYIDATYESIDIQTPGQREFSDETIVTCIKGHPCIIFWSQTGEEGSYKFIGKYNLNLDKATPEVFGFKHNEDNGFGYCLDGEKYYDENGVEQVAKASDKINSIFCYEFLDNGVQQCNFMSDDNSEGDTEVEKYKDSWYGTRTNKNSKQVPGWCLGFESRYPKDREGEHDADGLFEVASWINELYDLRINQKKEDEALARFKAEYEEYFDKDFLLVYYLITEMLLMIDSRVKNMMIATWGKKKWDSTQNKYVLTDHYIWYPIFYDMDTMLGLDNVGKPNKFWYDEDISEKGDRVFNGQGILWDFVRDALQTELTETFSKLESNGIRPFTASTILPYFNDNQADMANETIYNEDAEYKYMKPYLEGYNDDSDNGTFIKPGGLKYLYAEQGNRSMVREYFVNNRTQFLSGKHVSNNFKTQNMITFRITNFEKVEEGEEDLMTNPKVQASIAEVPSSGNYTIKTFKPGYVGINMGAAVGTVVKKYTNSNLSNDFTINSSLATGTECQLLGVTNIADLGDLSDKYLYNFITHPLSGENRIKRLKFGNHAQNYYNPQWKNDTDDLSLTGYQYLEDFDMENCSTYTRGLNFSDSPQIKRINIIGSGCNQLTLPENGVLEELRLPTSIKELTIDSHSVLSDDGFTLGYFDYETGQYVNDFSKLYNINIKNVPNLNTYEIVKEAIQNNLDKYCLQGVEWTIGNDESDLVIEENEVKGLVVLDTLLKNNAPFGGELVSNALTGTVVVEAGDYIVDEYEMYNLYHSKYPNLDITWHSTNLKKASFICFYSTEEVAGDPMYKVLTNGEQTLELLTSAEGPNGEKLGSPQKPQTNDTVYTFAGVWKVANAEVGSGLTVGTLLDQTEFNNYMPTGAVDFVATYTSTPRLYIITLYDDDESVIEVVKNGVQKLPAQLQWNVDIGEALSNVGQINYNYKPYTGTNENLQYYFVGWRSAADFAAHATEPTWETLDGKLVTSDFVAYATYKLKDYTQTPFDKKYFTCIDSVITIDDKYQELIQGVLHVPSGLDDNKPTTFGSIYYPCTDMKITKLLFEEGSNCTSIGDFAFQGNTTLTEIELPVSIKAIGSSSFSECSNLAKINNINNLINLEKIGNNAFGNCSLLEIAELPDSIKTIDIRAFANDSKISLTKLPSNLEEIYLNAFLNNTSLNIESFEGNKLKTIQTGAFAGCKSNLKTLYFGSSITFIGENAFQNYVVTPETPQKITIICRKDSNDYGNTWQDIFGLTLDQLDISQQ